jgi:hypothetical protein
VKLRLLALFAMLAFATFGAIAQAPAADKFTSPDGYYSWWKYEKDPNVMLLYFGAQRADGVTDWRLVGVLDPEAGSWRWAHKDKPIDLIKATGHKEGTGALPPANAPKPRIIDQGPVDDRPMNDAKKGTSREEWNRRLKEAGLPPLPVEADAPRKPAVGDKPPDCKCGTGCECMDGHRGVDCTCGDGQCKCAIVNKHKPLKGEPKAGVDDESKSKGVPDDRRVVKDVPVIDGEPLEKMMDRLHGNFGLIRNRIGEHGTRYTLADADGSREVGAAEAISAIESLPTGGGGGGTIPNDGCLPVITVIGTEQARKQVLADFDTHPSLSWIKGHARVQGEEPGSWRAGGERGFVQPAAGSVVIYAQTCDGKTLWRQDDYAGGAQVLAERLRDKVPGYDPAKDPQPNRPHGPYPAPPVGVTAWWILPASTLFVMTAIVIVVGLILVVMRRNK